MQVTQIQTPVSATQLSWGYKQVLFLVLPLRSQETELWRVVSDCWYFLGLTLASLQLPKANTGFLTPCSYKRSLCLPYSFHPRPIEGIL